MIELNPENIDAEIRKYLNLIDAIELPERQGTNIEYMLSLKRGKIQKGPYPNVSIFEASNRILSDIVILFGIRELLFNPRIGTIDLLFRKYQARLGNEDGFDIEAEFKGENLIGEAFNVARSFFPEKMRKMRAKLSKEPTYSYRLMIFNADAVPDIGYYQGLSEQSMMYLPVDWEKGVNSYLKI